MKFWDTSALVPIVIREPSSSVVRVLYQQDQAIVAWWGTRVEVVSALALALRRGSLRQDALTRALRRARRMLAAGTTIAPSATIRDRAERLLLTHELRAGDALQLASALIAVQERPQGVGFVSLDRRLRDAAGREGFTVYP